MKCSPACADSFPTLPLQLLMWLFKQPWALLMLFFSLLMLSLLLPTFFSTLGVPKLFWLPQLLRKLDGRAGADSSHSLRLSELYP